MAQHTDLRAFSACALVLLAGCAGSTDPTADLNESQGLVADRTGVETDWLAPPSDEAPGWDWQQALTPELAVRAALQNNRELRAEVEEIASGRADLVQAGLLPNPVLSVVLRAPFDPTGGATMVGASAMQEFADLWLRKHRVRAAEARLNEAVLRVSDRALRLSADVKGLHARIASGQVAIQLAEENLGAATKTLAIARKRFDAGEGTSLDSSRAEQRCAVLEAEVIRLKSVAASDRRRLLSMMGVAGHRDGDSWTVSAPAQVGAPMDEAIAVEGVINQRLDVYAARAAAEAKAGDLSVEERSRLNMVSLGVDFERDDGQKSIGPVAEIGVPIFDTGKARIARAGSEARASLMTYEAIMHRAISEARIATVEFNAALVQTHMYEDRVVALAEKNLSLLQATFEAGEVDATAVFEAQSALAESRMELNTLRLQALLACIELEYSMGGSLR